jgi:hypothetical protein
MARCEGVTQAAHPSRARERLLGLGNDLLLRLARDSRSLQTELKHDQCLGLRMNTPYQPHGVKWRGLLHFIASVFPDSAHSCKYRLMRF